MRNDLSKLSVRQDAAMAGAIFMSNTATRELCFRNSIFGLPLEYQSFVNNIKEGMPLFVFDHTERKLYGVFEAASDGGLNINRSAYQSVGCSYPAQVCFKIVWKCRPLTEDEFSPAIEENYYTPNKFYFDLSYHQIIRLYQLFDKKRVDHLISKISKSADFGKGHCRKETPEKRSLSPNLPHLSADHVDALLPLGTPNFPTVESNYPSTSTHQVVPLQFAPAHSSYHGQAELPYNSNTFLPYASTVDDIATQVTGHCSQTTKYHQDQFTASQSYSLPHKYPDKFLPSGCVAWDPTTEHKSSANHSYSSSLRYTCSCFPSPGYKTQDTTGGDINFMSSTVTNRAPPYPQFPLANPQGSSTNWKEHCDVPCSQYCFGPHEEIYGPEPWHLSKAKALTPPNLGQQYIPEHPEIPETVINQRKESFTDEDFENAQSRHGFNRNATGSSGHGNCFRAYLPDHLYKDPDIRSETNATVPGQRAQSNVFSRLSLNQPPLSKEISGPSLNQLVHSLSQRTKQWSNKDKMIANDVNRKLVSEQIMDITCALAEVNQPSFSEEESAGLPFLNFKRRSEIGNLDANLGKEISGKVKRRKLVRPSFGEHNNAGSSGKKLQANGLEEKKDSDVERGENKLTIDLNRPASIVGDLANEDDSTALCPVVKIHTEKPCEAHTIKQNCTNATEAVNKQDPSFDSAAHTEKVSLDLNVTDLNTMDESKLQAILSSSLFRALDKLRSGKLNNSEEAMAKICGQDMNRTVSMNSDGDAKPRCS